MKKAILSLGLIMLCAGVAMAQRKHRGDAEIPQPAVATTASASTSQTSLVADNMAFTDMVHDFGTVQEGPDATCEFTFKNTGKEPIIIEKAQPSCGCTVPQFSKEPVAPGATGVINVAYHTKNKPTAFTKTITVVSNAGTKVLTIKGTVEKAPSGSVPENSSMIRTN